MIRDALAGARGYLLKESADDEAVSAVRAAAAGRSYLGESVADKVLSGIVQAPLEQLTAREREVLQLVVQGKSNAEAAGILRLSPRSVETYRLRLMQKFAIRHGMIAIE
jgi:DNA-binding NarL/FixJ family response regulator